MMNMGILLRCYRPPLANVWGGGIRGHARAAGLSALLAATSAGISTVYANVIATQLQFVEPSLRY